MMLICLGVGWLGRLMLGCMGGGLIEQGVRLSGYWPFGLLAHEGMVDVVYAC